MDASNESMFIAMSGSRLADERDDGIAGLQAEGRMRGGQRKTHEAERPRVRAGGTRRSDSRSFCTASRISMPHLDEQILCACSRVSTRSASYLAVALHGHAPAGLVEEGRDEGREQDRGEKLNAERETPLRFACTSSRG
jgi:hypothetical protein